MLGLLLYVVCSVMIGRIVYALLHSHFGDGSDVVGIMAAVFWPAVVIALPIVIPAGLVMGLFRFLIVWRNK